MKLITQSLIIATLPSLAVADYVGLSFDFVKVENDLYTVRMYADFTSPNDQLHGVFGDAADPLYIYSEQELYQNQFGGPTSATINPALFPVFPSLEYDSWVTIGSENLYDNEMNDIGIDWGNFEAGGNIETDNGIWFSIPNSAQTFAGSDGRVLIAQLTTIGFGNIYGEINLTGQNASGETYYARNQYFSLLIPSPGCLFLLGLYGIKSRRRC